MTPTALIAIPVAFVTLIELGALHESSLCSGIGLGQANPCDIIWHHRQTVLRINNILRDGFEALVESGKWRTAAKTSPKNSTKQSEPSSQPAARVRATDTVSFYVSPNGSEARKPVLGRPFDHEIRRRLARTRQLDQANDCLSLSAPCRTPQYACSKAMNEWDFAGYDPFVRLSAGIYTGGCNLVGPVGTHTINIVGEQSASDPEQPGRCY
jgi:hypothetical protein